MVEITTPTLIRKIRDILGLRGRIINQSQNSTFPVVVANPSDFPVPVIATTTARTNFIKQTNLTDAAETTIRTTTTGSTAFITMIIINNGSATNAQVDFRAATAGTILISVFTQAAAAGNNVPIVIPLPSPIEVASAANFTGDSNAIANPINITVIGYEEVNS